MRRFLHILLNAATAVSLVLCVVTVLEWVRSGFVGDYVIHVNSAGLNWVQSGRGVLAIVRLPDVRATPGGWEWHTGSPDAADHFIAPGAFSASYGVIWESGLLGLTRVEGDQSYPIRRLRPDGSAEIDTVDRPYRLTAIRWRSLALLTALLPSMTVGPWLVRRACALLRRRRPPGLCPTCGYDLRATPDRCPECGCVPVGVRG